MHMNSKYSNTWKGKEEGGRIVINESEHINSVNRCPPMPMLMPMPMPLPMLCLTLCNATQRKTKQHHAMLFPQKYKNIRSYCSIAYHCVQVHLIRLVICPRNKKTFIHSPSSREYLTISFLLLFFAKGLPIRLHLRPCCPAVKLGRLKLLLVVFTLLSLLLLLPVGFVLVLESVCLFWVVCVYACLLVLVLVLGVVE